MTRPIQWTIWGDCARGRSHPGPPAPPPNLSLMKMDSRLLKGRSLMKMDNLCYAAAEGGEKLVEKSVENAEEGAGGSPQG